MNFFVKFIYGSSVKSTTLETNSNQVGQVWDKILFCLSIPKVGFGNEGMGEGFGNERVVEGFGNERMGEVFGNERMVVNIGNENRIVQNFPATV